MRKAWVVAMREYRANVRSKAFVIATALMPIFMFGTIIVQSVAEGRVDTEAKKIAVVDRSGKLGKTLLDAAEERNQYGITDESSGRQTKAKYDLEIVPPADDAARQLLDLSEKVRRRELFAFIDIDASILDGSAAKASAEPPSHPAVRYFSNQPTYFDAQRWLNRNINGRVQAVRLNEAGIDPVVVSRAMSPVEVENLGLMSVDASGHIKPAEEVNEMASFFVPFGLVMLMWMGLMFTAQPLLSGVLEEKMQRISEVLLGSVPPFQLMLGKLIGFVLVALTLMGIYFVGGYIVARQTGHADLIPVHLIGWFLIFLSTAILMYGSIFLAVGACCNDVREAQNLLLPVWIPMIVPMLFMTTIIQHPSSSLSTGLSLVPLWSPMVMIMRMAVPPGVPTWQPVVAIAGSLLTALIAVWAAGRIFRVGLLLSGKPPKVSQMMKWVLRG